MEDAYFNQQSKHDHYEEEEEEEEEEDIGSLPSFSEDEEDDEGSSSNSIGSSSLDLMEDATSSSSNGPLFEMSFLISQLPFKRGLSKHFEGKSQSFTSLSNVKGLEDLIKPERSFKKKLKPSKGYAWDLDKSLSPKKSSRAIKKKSSVKKGSFSSLMKIRQSILGRKPLFSPKRSGSVSSQILVFAERSLETIV